MVLLGWVRTCYLFHICKMAFMAFTFVLLATLLGNTIADDVFTLGCQAQSREYLLRIGSTHHFHRGPVPDRIFIGKSYRNMTTSSYVTCAVLCLQEDACKSFNYCNERLCQLNLLGYSDSIVSLQPAKGCHYFDENDHKATSAMTVEPTPCNGSSFTVKGRETKQVPQAIVALLQLEFTAEIEAHWADVLFAPNQFGGPNIYKVALGTNQARIESGPSEGDMVYRAEESGNINGNVVLITIDSGVITVGLKDEEGFNLTYTDPDPPQASSWYITLYCDKQNFDMQ